MSALAVLGVRWSAVVIVAISFAAVMGVRRLLVEPSTAHDAVKHRFRLGQVLTWLSVAAAFLCVAGGGAASIDLLLFWGPKAVAFATARTIDSAYLADPMYAYQHPSYPPLVTNLFAFATMVAGKLPWRTVPLVFPTLLAGLAMALPSCFRRFLGDAEAWAMTSVIVCGLSLLGTEADIGGNGDMPLWLFEILGMALLVSKDARERSIQWLIGVMLGGAATTKVEGLAFGIAASAIFVVVGEIGRESRVRVCLRLLGPTGLVLGLWFSFGVLNGLFFGFRGYGEFQRLYLGAFPDVVAATLRALGDPAFGLPFLVPFAVFFFGPPPKRVAALPIGVALALTAFFVFTYLHDPEPQQWISWSAARIFGPISALLVIAGAASGESRGVKTAALRSSPSAGS